ncbi:UPF0721 transmembrane protein [Mangrovihabitans endophyticus]|uniref:Probable membrane transporter protein n=1 Tax=Mangrovihabitans endophyticus TaxID=1751298 RepID=A0A8J3C502_9ACTN|nr:UPF0721 transmembrane protein [Mangrovihabitans endophyticus]
MLGGLGGGGAILTVPALVYLLGQSPQDATTSSLIIVGLTAVVGAAGHARAGTVRWRTGLTFGVTGIVAAFAGTVANRHVPPHVLLYGFAALMIVAAAAMLLQTARRRPAIEPAVESGGARGPAGSVDVARKAAPTRGKTATKIIIAGLAVGFLTGFLGVGGGFVIVPALVLALDLPMSAAVGTSLVIIAINSATSLAARAGGDPVDWATTAPFAIAAMAASLGGRRLAARVPEAIATRAFAVLVLLVAGYTIANTVISS